MKLDREFARDVAKQANGDGSRDAKFAFLKRVRAAKEALSTIQVRTVYDKAITEFGRVPVAICTAVTIWERRDRLSRYAVSWAMEVLKLWTNRPHNTLMAHIDDGIHPTRIEDYARVFMRLTTEEE